MNVKSKHVVPNPRGGWSVRTSGAQRAARTFETQGEAVTYGRDMARKDRAELYVHGRDGTIKTKNSYGRDPFPPKDKKN